MKTTIINKWYTIELESEANIKKLRSYLDENGYKYVTTDGWNCILFDIYLRLGNDRTELENFIENDIYA